MKERPILFSGEMVRAILDGRKTQTRRVVKPQPSNYSPPENVHKPKHSAAYFDSYCNKRKTDTNPRGMSEHWCWWTPDDRQGADWIKCPYGVPGDRLWVRESWNVSGLAFGMKPRLTKFAAKSAWKYQATDTDWQHGWKPSIHMPRWASRLTLEITAVRVERLQDITTEQILAEGVAYPVSERRTPLIRVSGKFPPLDYLPDGEPTHEQLLSAHFASLWDSINGAESWNANPWVWVLTFKRIDNGATP